MVVRLAGVEGQQRAGVTVGRRGSSKAPRTRPPPAREP